MLSKKTESGDSENTGFGLPEKVAHEKPGVNHGGPKRKVETGGNHQFRRSQQKDIPQGTLAERIGKSQKGD